MQHEYLDMALDFLDATADYPAHSLPYWTCEVTGPVMRWLEATNQRQIDRFAAYVNAGRIGISGFEVNTTPLCSAEQLSRQLYPAQALRDRFGAKIVSVHQHDVNGVPWALSDLMLDSGIDLFVMGINLHFGGAAANRPGVFRWQTPSGRELLVMNGNQYTMFDQILNVWDDSVARMQQGLAEYEEVLAQIGYPHDFLYLTATNPPNMWDNNPPNLKVAELIRAWNEQGLSPTIRFVSPAMLRDRLRQLPREWLPLYYGDWTDYWNFGCASTADETRRNQNTKPLLSAAELIRSFRPATAPYARPAAEIADLSARAWSALNLYDEHTWGAAGSIRQPDDPHTKAQRHFKLITAYDAHEMGQYLLVHELEALAQNPPQTDAQEGVLLVNPTPVAVDHVFSVADQWFHPGKRLRTNRFTPMQHWATVRQEQGGTSTYGPVHLPPYSWRKVPLRDLVRAQVVPPSLAVRTGRADGVGFLENTYLRLEYGLTTGQITSVFDKQRSWQVLPADREYGFFEFIHERPDPRLNPTRNALYNRDAQREKFGLSCWQTDWVAQRRGVDHLISAEVEADAEERYGTLVLKFTAPGVEWLEQRVTLHAESPMIDLEARLMKTDIRTPEATYFVFPLNLEAGWASHFDTAGLPTALDDDQLPRASRDWVTVESYAAVHQGGRGATLFCPDAPMVQIGDFNFGRKQDAIPRSAHPLLLAWPLNNYWDTNFAASQPGLIHLRYRFAPHSAFDPSWARREGQATAQRVLVHPLMTCPAVEAGTFFEVQGDAAANVHLLHAKPAADGQGVILRLVNLASSAAAATIALPGQQVRGAFLTTPAEVNVEALQSDEERFTVTLPSLRIMTIRAVLG
jgi:hypothetical protein